MMGRVELLRVLRAMRRSRREASVRVYEALVVLADGERTSLALERVLGYAGTRRVLYEALHGGYVVLSGDVWCLSERGAEVVKRLECCVYGEGKEG